MKSPEYAAAASGNPPTACPSSIMAVRLHAHGQPVRVEEVAGPRQRPGELLVRMSRVALNPLDLRVIEGHIASHGPLPRIIGVEGVGYIGDQPVVVYGAGTGLVRDGTLAEWISVPPGAVIEVPAGVSLDAAAACGISGATVIRLMEVAQPVAGQRALVFAASGVVGGALCSLLAAMGVEALAQIRNPADAGALTAPGIEPLVVPEPAALEAALKGRQVDMVFDPLGGAWTRTAIGHFAYGGRHIIFGTKTGAQSDLDLLQFYRRGLTVRGYGGVMEPQERQREAVVLALQAVADGRLKLLIGERRSLRDAAEALAILGGKPRGKVMVDIAS